MSVLTLRIDGVAVAVPKGTTLLQACRAAGVTLPVLCHHDRLAPVAACRLCLVQLAGVERPTPACHTLCAEGMEVQTSSAALVAQRRLVLELLLAEGQHPCPVCVADGACELQDRARELGVLQLELDEQFPRRAVDASHPRFVLDRNRCILCTRCVRACAAIEGAHVWDVAGRGADCRLIAGLDQPWGEVEDCTSCGLCVEVCPTAALHAREDGP